ncbi:hypothetical protein MPEAHAMD_6273 [Methylobacterium frigidaeris]|uniref:Uncharacterized protein n=1 Tax=Methylobacterium frigidaeris TaxID=2038277 RepID=A0AA37HHU7_9HYPH|nr:hypothetical protein MPEAHAMD_6273 [Methylobacterium frigidaeris]
MASTVPTKVQPVAPSRRASSKKAPAEKRGATASNAPAVSAPISAYICGLVWNSGS